MKFFKLVFLLSFTLSLGLQAHSGRTNKEKCHNVYEKGGRKVLDYHCHKVSIYEPDAPYLNYDKFGFDKEANFIAEDEVLIISWNAKHLGRERFDYQAAAYMLSNAQLITFQEVNKRESGLKALKIIKERIEKLTKEKVCMGLSDVPTDSKERYAYLWKNEAISYVKTNGRVIEDCPSNTAINVGLQQDKLAQEKIRREPSKARFRHNESGQKFILSSIHLRPRDQRPQDEVPVLFESFKGIRGPIIIAGDYNLNSGHKSFKAAKRLNFTASFAPHVRTSLKKKKRELNMPYDNFWFRKITHVESAVINTYDLFKGYKKEVIYDIISDHSPIIARFRFQ